MVIKYCAPYRDYSGYGETSRHHIAALDAVGVKVIGELLSYASENADYGTLGAVLHKVTENKGNYDIKLLHATPDEFTRLVEKDKYNIGFCYWETDKIPDAFAKGLESVDEIWTASQANFDAIRAGGVQKPIYIFPQPMEVDRKFGDPYLIHDFNGALLYSIFEWTDRKNPDALIRAFLEEFDESDNVGLLIKTYFRNFSFSNKKLIKNRIEMIKNGMEKKGKFPPIFLYLDLMDRTQLQRIHATGDIFVSTHRGEGWGLPQVEALLAGNPIISSNYGGVHEYLDSTMATLIDGKMVQLKGMEHNQRFYSPDQKWLDVNINDVKKAMRNSFNNRTEGVAQAKNGRQFIKERFNLKRVGSEMLDRLNAIEAKNDK